MIKYRLINKNDSNNMHNIINTFWLVQKCKIKKDGWKYPPKATVTYNYIPFILFVYLHMNSTNMDSKKLITKTITRNKEIWKSELEALVIYIILKTPAPGEGSEHLGSLLDSPSLYVLATKGTYHALSPPPTDATETHKQPPPTPTIPHYIRDCQGPACTWKMSRRDPEAASFHPQTSPVASATIVTACTYKRRWVSGPSWTTLLIRPYPQGHIPCLSPTHRSPREPAAASPHPQMSSATSTITRATGPPAPIVGRNG